jgi:hypothetical protein
MADAARERERNQAEEKLNDLFEPDTLLPTQFFGALKRKRFPSGEHRLLVAIMRDAVDCFQKHIHARDAKRRQLFLDADAWIADGDDRSAFSFNNCCETLGLNPDYVRAGLQDWRDSQRQLRRVGSISSRRRREGVRIESPLQLDTARYGRA